VFIIVIIVTIINTIYYDTMQFLILICKMFKVQKDFTCMGPSSDAR